MGKIILTIDDKEIEATEGMTVLEAAKEAGIYIPTLCYHPSLSPYGGCRLCIVEIEKMRGFPTSCTTPAGDGMVVKTNTPQLQEFRQGLLELILTEHPHVCLTCDRKERCEPFDICLRSVAITERCVLCPKNGSCELQQVADYVGMKDITLPYTYKELPIHREDSFFDRDYNLCILCGRCVRICQEVRGIGAIAFTYRGSQALVGTAFNRPLSDSSCKFCGACVEVCPTGALMDKALKWNRVTDREDALVPCKHACPLGIDVPRYVRLIGEQKFTDALAVVAEKTPFPLICGTVCHHPCEDKCRRGEINDPIAIMALKRFVAEHPPEGGIRQNKSIPPSGKRVAVVGSGPAGLTAAYYLARLRGHSVTVFEALREPGGMMRYGIPEYHLPRKVLNSEIDLVRGVGVDIKTNTKIDSLNELFEQGYDAIFIAIGANQDVNTKLDGEEAPNVLHYVSFLREVNSGRRVEVGDNVAIIGGEVRAIDAARTVLRLGAKEVTILYSARKEQIPGEQDEINEALEEGVKILFLTTPTRIVRKNGKLRLEYASLQPDQQGKFALDIDTVIVASRRIPEIPEKFDLEINEGNTLRIDPTTLTTSREGVFAGGDAVTGSATVTEAIAAGRKGAIAIDKYLGGSGLIDEELAPVEEPETWLGSEENFAYQRRCEMPHTPVEQRLSSFSETEHGYNEEAALKESLRCLQCDLRLKIPPVELPLKQVPQ